LSRIISAILRGGALKVRADTIAAFDEKSPKERSAGTSTEKSFKGASMSEPSAIAFKTAFFTQFFNWSCAVKTIFDITVSP
jgi:hypothetical protein